MKYIKFTLPILFSFFFLNSCLTINYFGFTRVVNEISDEYLVEEYGEGTVLRTKFLMKYEFESYIHGIKEAVVNNKDLSEDEKEQLLEQIDSIKYSQRQFLAFILQTDISQLGKKLDFSFSLEDSSGNNPIKNMYALHQKVYYGSYFYNNYIWIIETNKAILEDNYDTFPFMFTIEFPDKKRIECSIEPPANLEEQNNR